jgi:hypothetical protein
MRDFIAIAFGFIAISFGLITVIGLAFTSILMIQ